MRFTLAVTALLGTGYAYLAARLASGPVGVNVATRVGASYETMPDTGVAPGPRSVNVAAVSVAAFIGSLNVALIGVLTGTPTAVSAGTVEVTVGAVVSGAVPVVKVHVRFIARPLPATSFEPVVTVAV